MINKKNEQESSGNSHGSCENNNVSLLEILETFPNENTVKTTHLQICKSIVPGRRFLDVARNLAFNEVKNAFILSTNKQDKLRTRGRFTVIKDPSNIFSSPKIAFASFYPDQFEYPIIEMIPDESVIPSGEKEVRVPSFDVLLTCVNESEIKIVLESRLKWKETLVTRNFVVVSPKIASSIAGLDRSALALNVLSEVIKTLKDLNLTTTNESGKVTEPINKLITF